MTGYPSLFDTMKLILSVASPTDVFNASVKDGSPPLLDVCLHRATVELCATDNFFVVTKPLVKEHAIAREKRIGIE